MKINDVTINEILCLDPAQGAMIKLKGVPKEKLEGEDRKLTTYTVFANSIRKLLGAWPNQFDPKLTSGKLNGMVENKIPIVVRGNSYSKRNQTFNSEEYFLII